MIKEKNTKILSNTPETCIRMASRRNFRNGFVLSPTFLCPKRDEGNLNQVSSSCPKRQHQREATSEGGRGRGQGNGHSWQNEQMQQAFHTVFSNPCGLSFSCRTRTADTNRAFGVTVEGKEVEVPLQSASRI